MMKAHLYFRALPIQDVERSPDGRFAKIPVRAGVKLPQLGLQGGNIHILVVVKVAEPAENIIISYEDKYKCSE